MKTQSKRHYKANDKENNKENNREIQENILQAEIREKEVQLEQRIKEIEKELVRCRHEEEQFFTTPYFLALAELQISLRETKQKLRRKY